MCEIVMEISVWTCFLVLLYSVLEIHMNYQPDLDTNADFHQGLPTQTQRTPIKSANKQTVSYCGTLSLDIVFHHGAPNNLHQ